MSLAYTPDSRWRNRAEFPHRTDEIVAFLTRKWAQELDYRLIKELWAFTDNRIAVRFAYEWHDDSGNWFRSYGNENWEFDAAGLMQRRFACINDLPIKATTGSSTGLSDGVRTITLGSQSWVFEPRSTSALTPNIPSSSPKSSPKLGKEGASLSRARKDSFHHFFLAGSAARRIETPAAPDRSEHSLLASRATSQR